MLLVCVIVNAVLGSSTICCECDAVIKLTVSAGESKLLQLPKDSITLSAFAIPNAGQG